MLMLGRALQSFRETTNWYGKKYGDCRMLGHALHSDLIPYLPENILRL